MVFIKTISSWPQKQMRSSMLRDDSKKLTRRDFLKVFGIGLLDIVLLAIGGVGYSMLVEPNWLKVEKIKLKLPRLPHTFSGFRIAQISDIHMGSWMNVDRFQRVADMVLAQKPDVLLITGDFLTGHRFSDGSRQAVKDLITVLSPLAKSIPTFAILGNHDYWTNPEAIREMLGLCGIPDLTNTVFRLTREDQYLYLCGVDDIWEGDVRLEDVVSQLTDNSAAILLAHEPDFADTSAAAGKFDLQISGHSHGGQVVIPFVGPPILPYLGRKYPSGLYKIGEMFQYTNRGVGMIKPSVRFNCLPEITVFTLESL
jgi:predicted MPP superfamily phosphohydrolase